MTDFYSKLVHFIFLFGLITPVQAADAGDIIAALLGTFLGIICICALIGWRHSESEEGYDDLED